MILATWWDNIGGDYHRFSFVLAVIVSIMAICVSVLILRRYIEKKTRIAGLLAGFLITLSLAFVLDPIFLLIRGFMGIDLVEFQSLFSLGWTSFANVFLVYFLKEYFYDNQDHWAIKPIAIGAASVLPCVMIMYVIGGPAVIFLILHLIISFPLYLYQFIKSRAIVKMLEKEEEVDILASKGFKYIGLSGLAMFLTLVFLIFNEVTLVFPDFFMSIGLLKEDASIFVGIGVIFGGLAAIFYYIGFIMPGWIRDRWLRQAEQKKKT